MTSGWDAAAGVRQARSAPEPGPAGVPAAQITAVDADLREHLASLPWDRPLAEWDGVHSDSLGLSRHTVRTVDCVQPGAVEGTQPAAVVIKEMDEDGAGDEYRLLHALRDARLPAVCPLGVVTGRTTAASGALITRRLTPAARYDEILRDGPRSPAAHSVVEAFAELLAHLHRAGFFWGDAALSNTLFSPSSDGYTAWLVDAETGELHPSLSEGQKTHDLELARLNMAGELFNTAHSTDEADLASVRKLDSRLVEAYRSLTGAD
ncbi:3-deoxy-D-manno-octulosonic-acid kinase [Brevibacterium ravenspurgense]|uniref:3-deoxy-D-manno-octulosonic-acid kinase n=1 Tax=Brevibacterium ravenspurgense TaxID=479117 RepID=A0A150HAL3_9MICO|nr:3-deoxy-D-manno-octulosonic-acid kinase [Brevibacterium ravenspurgense]